MAPKDSVATQAAEQERKVARVRARLAFERPRGKIASLSASELDELHDLVVRTDATPMIVEGSGRLVRTVVDTSGLSDAEFGRYVRLLDAARRAGVGREDVKKPRVRERIAELARAALGSDAVLPVDRALAGWKEAAADAGAVLSSRELYEQVRDGTLEPADVLALMTALWALQLSGGREATLPKQPPFRGSIGRSLDDCMKHLDANEWLDVSRPGGGAFTVRLGVRARAEIANARRGTDAGPATSATGSSAVA